MHVATVNCTGNDLFSSSTPRAPATHCGTYSAAAKPAKAPGRITKVEFASYADCTAGRARNRICTADGGSPSTTGAGLALRVASVPRECEPDPPRVLGCHRTTSLRQDAAHVPRHEQRWLTQVPLCVPWPPSNARPPLQSQTLCALMPPLIRKRGRASAIYLVSGGTSWNDRLIFFGWDARHLELISPGVAILSQPHRVVISVYHSSRIEPCVGMWRQSDALCLAGSRQVQLLTLRCGEQNRALPRAVQSQESNVPPGYGVGWRSPPGLVESVGIHNG